MLLRTRWPARVGGGGRREKKRGSNLALATSALSRDDKMDPDLFLVKIEEKKRSFEKHGLENYGGKSRVPF